MKILIFVIFSLSCIHSLTGQLAFSDTLSGSGLQEIFAAQLEKSCYKKFQYDKEVIPFSTSASKSLTVRKKYIAAPGCSLRSGESILNLNEELHTGLRYNCLNVRTREYFELNIYADSIIGRVRENESDNSPLRFQKIAFNNGKILYIESEIVKSNWLYTDKFHIRIYFDQEGKYRSHVLLIRSEIRWAGSFFLAVIKGKAKYHSA